MELCGKENKPGFEDRVPGIKLVDGYNVIRIYDASGKPVQIFDIRLDSGFCYWPGAKISQTGFAIFRIDIE